MTTATIHHGDCLAVMGRMEAQSVHCCVTSPPYYGLRDYGHDGQIGLEETPQAYVEKMVQVFREVRRVLRDDGTLWLNLGDSYARAGGWSNNNGLDGVARGEGNRAMSNMTGEGGASQKLANGLKEKDLIGIPWRVAFALQADGWYLRQDIIWAKPNPMPESVRDRCTKAHEYIFLLSKSPRYYYDAAAIAEPVAPASIERLSQPSLEAQNGSARVPGKTNGNMKAVGEQDTRNKRSVWTVTTQPFREAHFAVFPVALIEPCILAGCPADGTVLDPFGGAGTTAMAAIKNGRNAILCELNSEYVAIAKRRIDDALGMFGECEVVT